MTMLKHNWAEVRDRYLAFWRGENLDRPPVIFDTIGAWRHPMYNGAGYDYTKYGEDIAALLCGCVPPERREAVLRIARRVTQGRFVSGAPSGRTLGTPSEQEAPDGIVALGTLYFLFYALEVLFDAGDGSAAIGVIRREWGRMAELGFKTCPESIGWTRSTAHGWSSAPAAYLPMHVLGIRPLEPGYRTFVVDPVPGDLAWARGTVVTPHGPIHASWRRNTDGCLQIECIAPAECRRVEHS